MFYLGIDLGGTNIAAGIVDENHGIIAKDSVPTQVEKGPEQIIDNMAKLSQQLIGKNGLRPEEIAWVGVGTPGTANAETGIIEYANNLKFDNLPMVEMLEPKVGKKVYIENDANAAAYGEFVAGAAKGSRSAVVITLGTGVGSGIIIDGRILHGFNYAGGEFGHVVIEYDGVLCTCGRKGCWESYSSATGLIYMTREAMEKDRASRMWEIAGSPDRVNGKTAFDAMRAGDAAGKAVVDKYLAYLGCGLVNVVNLFQPEILCIGGGICHEGDTIIKPLQAIIEAARYSKHSNKQTRLCTAQLGNDAGIIGAAMLGRLYEG